MDGAERRGSRGLRAVPAHRGFSRLAVPLAMASHARLGRDSPLHVLPGECLREIALRLPLAVPEACETVGAALAEVRRLRRRWGRHAGVLCVSLGPGIHEAAGSAESEGRATLGQRLADPEVVVHADLGPVAIEGRGPELTTLRGMLVGMPGSSVLLRGLLALDAGDCCVKVTGRPAGAGGEGDETVWVVEDCVLRCGHSASVRTGGSGTRVTLRRCVLGGEGLIGGGAGEEGEDEFEAYGSVQKRTMVKHACWAVTALGQGLVELEGCVMRWCSEACVCVAGRTEVSLLDTELLDSACAFIAGDASKGDSGLQVRCSGPATRVQDVRVLWHDADRPVGGFLWHDSCQTAYADLPWTNALGDLGIQPLD